MKQEIDYSRYVDRYLDGVMSASELNWFEKELQDNAELESEINLQKKIETVISDQETIELQVQLNDIYTKTYRPWKKTITIPKLKKKSLYIATGAATILLLLFLAVYGIIRHRSSTAASSAKIYAQYYQPADINMSFRTAEDIVDSDLRLAMLSYENKEFEKAIELFEKIIKSDNSRIGLNLYSGISRMEIQQYAEANKNFKMILDHKANAFIESAEWYLGLCYLMTEENIKAREIFTAIASSDGYYRKEARRILRRMN